MTINELFKNTGGEHRRNSIRPFVRLGAQPRRHKSTNSFLIDKIFFA
jgi:hypothetical protein